MAKCNQGGCKGLFEDRVSEYGPFWSCSMCKHTINKRCGCGGIRKMMVINGSTVAKCSKCRKPTY